MAAFSLTIFTGAFLLFLVQPLIGRYILPWFGGGPGVWTACMLFFQLTLLTGYGYAHYSRERFPLRRQALIHGALLVIALLFLPITPSAAWRPTAQNNPTVYILVLLAANIGVPFLVLSSTGPLLQHWFSQLYPGAAPYRLYALSNVGSLLALLVFPFVLEPRFPRDSQAGLWGVGLVFYAICCGWCALKVWRVPLAVSAQVGGAPVDDRDTDTTTTAQRLLWFLLPACASVLLLATTNKLCQDVAVVPFLWVLPLAIYLLSFIIAFDSPRWYVRSFFALALIAALSLMCWALFHLAGASILKQVVAYSAALFVCCMVCHGELYRLRPPTRYLTAFYLVIAIGGAFGGMFVGLAAPLFFKDFVELHWGLFLCGVLFLIVCIREKQSETTGAGTGFFAWDNWRTLACALPFVAFFALDWLIAGLGNNYRSISKGWFLGIRLGIWGVFALFILSWLARGTFRTFRYWRMLACLWLTTGLFLLTATLWTHAHAQPRNLVQKSRSFFGVLSILEEDADDPLRHHFLLQHGRITHGLQLAGGAAAQWPTTYYGEDSGVGLAMDAVRTIGRRVGVVGLGTGTLASYGQFGDTFRFYEINPEVIRLAATRFSYLQHSPAEIRLVLGDARLSMETESPQDYNLLVLDAFSSDSIPVHLLTKEAFQLYLRHLNPNGIIAVHISNKFLNLEPVVGGLVEHFHLHAALIDQDDVGEEWWVYPSLWVLLSPSSDTLTTHAVLSHPGYEVLPPTSKKFPLWTDDFTSLYQIIK